MSDPFLSRDDLRRIACRQKRKAVVASLERMGYRFEVGIPSPGAFMLDGEGWPLIPRQLVFASSVEPMHKHQPNFNALNS